MAYEAPNPLKALSPKRDGLVLDPYRGDAQRRRQVGKGVQRRGGVAGDRAVEGGRLFGRPRGEPGRVGPGPAAGDGPVVVDLY